MTAALCLLLITGDTAGAVQYLTGWFEGETRAPRRRKEGKN